MNDFDRPNCKYEEVDGKKLIVETIPITVFRDDLHFYDKIHAGVLHHMAEWKRSEYGFMVESKEPSGDNREGIKEQILLSINRLEYHRSQK